MTDSSPVPGAASAPTRDSAAPPATASATITPSSLSTLLSTTHARSANRCCFMLRVRPDLLTEYVEVHQHVWEEMLQALLQCGWRNYSLFLRPEDGLVVGYFEADDVTAAMATMDSTEVNTRWQAEMARCFVQPDDGTPTLLDQYFYLP